MELPIEEDVGPERVWSDQRPQKPDDEICSYLKSVGGSLESSLDDESRSVLLKNVFEEIVNLEGSLACNRRTAVVLENLLKEAPASELVTFFKNIRKYFGFLSTNRQASFVIQKLFERIFVVFQEAEEEIDKSEGIFELVEILLDLTKTLVVNQVWLDMMFDPCATHVIRGLILVLANKPPSKSMKGKIEKASKPNPSLVASLLSFLVDTSKWERKHLKDACLSTYAGPVIQLLMETCSNKHKAWKTILIKILSDEDGGDCDPTVFLSFCHDKFASHIAQIIVSHCDDETYESLIFNQCIKGKMEELCHSGTANFVLQSVIGALRTPEQREAMLQELEPGISSNLLNNKLGVVWKVCEACKLGDKAVQRRMCRAILNGIRQVQKNKGSDRGAIEALLDLELVKKPVLETDAGDDEEENVPEFSKVKVSIMGARITGSLVQYAPESSRAILESIASMNQETLKVLCNDPVGGKFVMENLMDAPLGSSWAKQRVLVKLKDDIGSVGENKFGWHVIRKAFDGGTVKERMLIAKALSKKERRLVGSTFGALLFKHCKVSLYKQHAEQWIAEQQHMGHKEKVKKLESMLVELDTTQIETVKRKKKRDSSKSKKLKV